MAGQRYTPRTSFSNLFPKIWYDREQLAEPILDIWNNYRLVSFPIGLTDASYLFYTVSPSDTLYSISDNFYQTIEYWWLIPLMNDAEDPFRFLPDVLEGRHPLDLAAKRIRVLKPALLHTLTQQVLAIQNIVSEKNRKESLGEENG